MFRIPPSEIDERMSSRDAVDVLEYLAAYPETAETVDIQMARLMQMVGSMGGGNIKLEDARIRGRAKTEEETAADWIRYLDERENRIRNQL